MHSDWFNGIDILQGRWQHGEKVEYCYPSGIEKTLCKWEIYVLLVTKGLIILSYSRDIVPDECIPTINHSSSFTGVTTHTGL
jgi:hypothetical protein